MDGVDDIAADENVHDIDNISIDTLLRLERNGNIDEGARLMGGRRKLVIDQKYLIHRLSPYYVRDTPSVFLDLEYCGPRSMGMRAAFLPEDSDRLDWQLKIDAKFTLLRPWRAKRVEPGFETDGRSFYFGRTPDNAHVFIFFLPNPDGPDITVDFQFLNTKARRTRKGEPLSPINSRKFLVFICHVLQTMGHRSVMNYVDYPDVDNLSALSIATNLM